MMQSREIIRDDTMNASKITYKTSRSNLTLVCYAVYKKQQPSVRLRCLIFLRGGYNTFGSLTPDVFTTKSYITALASHGFFIIAPQYPGVDGGDGSDQYGEPDDIDSIISLKNVLTHSDFNDIVDSTNVGILGVSRGGMAAYQVMRTNPPWLKAVVVVAGPVDQKHLWKLRPEMKELAQKVYGATVEGANDRSVIKWYQDLPRIPLLILHGSLDTHVSVDSTLRFARRLTKIKYPYKLVVYGDRDHFLLSRTGEEVTQWFWENL